MTDVLEKLTVCVRDLFDEYEGPITRDLSAKTVPQWDSLANVQLMVLVEQTFGIRFSPGQVQTFRNLGDLLDAVNAKMAVRR